MALVAKTFPSLPTQITIILAITTHKSIIEIGFFANFKRPKNPKYFERQPADHNRMQYSNPKNTTRNTSLILLLF